MLKRTRNNQHGLGLGRGREAGFSTAQPTMRLWAASVEMTEFFHAKKQQRQRQ
jgi:hypothetical protein